MRLANPAWLLLSGVLLRVLVFVFLSPFNNDGHWDVVLFIHEKGRLPVTGELTQSYHPPLYYLLAQPFLGLTGSAKGVQALSLILSIGTLLALQRLLFRTPGLVPAPARLYTFALACLLPQLVLFTLFISNDSLAVFLGALVALQACRFVETARTKDGIGLASLLALGLLTKHTFLAFVPVLLALVWRVSRRRSTGMRPLAVAALFLTTALLPGAYKTVENALTLGRPFATALDFPADWISEQKRFHRGWRSFLDVNLLALVTSPVRSQGTSGAYPLLLYATFWYSHIPESSFIGSRFLPYAYVGSAIYVVALAPTLAAAVGGVVLLRRAQESRTARPGPTLRRTTRSALSGAALFLLLVANTALLLATILEHRVWSIMQGRLLFPSIAGFLVAHGVGLEAVRRRFPRTGRLLLASLVALLLLFVLYFGLELGYQVVAWLDPELAGRIRTLKMSR